MNNSTPRQISQVDSKIKKLQNELQHKVQTYDVKRIDPRNDYGPQTEIKKLVKQFDPLDDSNKMEKNFDHISSLSPVIFRTNSSNNQQKFSPNISERHPSLFENILTNHVYGVLQNIQTNYGTASRFYLPPNHSMPQQNNLIHFSPALTAPAHSFPKLSSTISDEPLSNFDPLVSKDEKISSSSISSASSSETNGSNLIDWS